MKLRTLLGGVLILVLIFSSQLVSHADDHKIPHIDSKTTIATATVATTDTSVTATTAASTVQLSKPVHIHPQMFPLAGKYTGFWSLKVLGLFIVVIIGVASTLLIPINKSNGDGTSPQVLAVVPPSRKAAPAVQFRIYK